MKVTNKEATIQSDGWTGVNNHHLVAFMITADKKVWRTDIFFFGLIIIDLLNMAGPYSRSTQYNKGTKKCRKLFEGDRRSIQ